MNRLVLAGVASVALAASALASPPPGPPPVRSSMPVVIRPVYPTRPVIGVTVVPTTPIPRTYVPYTPVVTVRPTYAVYFRYDPLMPWSRYAAYSSLWRAEDEAFWLEYAYGYEAFVR